MHFDPAHPTIAGLQAARRTSAFFRTRPVQGPGPEGLLVEALSSALRPGAAVVRRPVVDMPFGAAGALLAIVAPGRRIAVVEATPGDAGGTEAALMLVYGTFDAVYVVRADDLASRSPRTASEIAEAEPRLFTARGRRALSLCAVAPRLSGTFSAGATDRPPVLLLDRSRDGVRAMRLNRPSEWSGAFEEALAAARVPLPRSA
jgi:hypothetical protein